MAFDGGSGFDFWLPHVSPHDIEGPNKIIDKMHTSPLKVMNGYGGIKSQRTQASSRAVVLDSRVLGSAHNGAASMAMSAEACSPQD